MASLFKNSVKSMIPDTCGGSEQMFEARQVKKRVIEVVGQAGYRCEELGEYRVS